MPNVPMSTVYRRTLPPCKDCADRHIGCHSECDGYKEWKEQEGKRKTDAVQTYRYERAVEDYEIKERIKNMKRRGR